MSVANHNNVLMWLPCQQDGDPPMPIMSSSMPSGSTPRVKTKFLTNTLTDETAKGLGLLEFYRTYATSSHVMICNHGDCCLQDKEGIG